MRPAIFDREYNAWKEMRKRCTLGYYRSKDYADRGIKVCERWDYFENFILDMGCKPSSKHSLDRIDNDGNYEPSNCKWSTVVEQNNNQRLRVDNVSGLKGVQLKAKDLSWIVTFKSKYIKSTPDFFEACCLRKSAEAQFRAIQNYTEE